MPILRLWRTESLFSLGSLTMKARHPSRHLKVRKRVGMAKALNSTLLQRLSIRNQPCPRMLSIQTPFQGRQLLANLVGCRCSPVCHKLLTQIPTLLIKQLIILSKANNPRDLTSSLPTRQKLEALQAPLTFRAARNPISLVSSLLCPLLKQRKAAMALCLHHLLRPRKRKAPLVNPRSHSLLRPRQTRPRPSPESCQRRLKQLHLRIQAVFSINQQPRQPHPLFHLKHPLCSDPTGQRQSCKVVTQKNCQIRKKSHPILQFHSGQMRHSSLRLRRPRRLPNLLLPVHSPHQTHSPLRISLYQHLLNFLSAMTLQCQHQNLNSI